MNRAFLYLIILAVALSTTLPFAQRSSAAEPTKVSHTIITTTGDPAPSGGSYLPGSFSTVRLNPRHDVAFDAAVGPPFTSGVFVANGKTISTIALGTNPDPAAPSFGFVSDPFITPNGEVVFDVNSVDSYRSDGKTIIPLARDGDAAPGGGTLTPNSRAVSDHGDIAYLGFVSGATATQGIFRSDGSQTIAIARDDIAPPTGGAFVLLDDVSINDRGQVAFFSAMTGGSADFGVFRGEGGELTPVFVSNQTAPGGATFNDFGIPVINRHGQVATSASLTNGDNGLFVGDGTNAVAIALEGQAAPKGGIFRDPTGRHLTFRSSKFNDRGEVAFDAALTGSPSPIGIFRGDGTRTTAIALAKTTAPGTTGTFASFRDFRLLNDGRVAFIASLTVGVGGVSVSNSLGIWIGTSDADLQLVARTGDVIDGKVLTNFPAVRNGLDVNENAVVWVGAFGPTRSIVLSQILGEDAALL